MVWRRLFSVFVHENNLRMAMIPLIQISRSFNWSNLQPLIVSIGHAAIAALFQISSLALRVIIPHSAFVEVAFDRLVVSASVLRNFVLKQIMNGGINPSTIRLTVKSNDFNKVACCFRNAFFLSFIR